MCVLDGGIFWFLFFNGFKNETKRNEKKKKNEKFVDKIKIKTQKSTEKILCYVHYELFGLFVWKFCCVSYLTNN